MTIAATAPSSNVFRRLASSVWRRRRLYLTAFVMGLGMAVTWAEFQWTMSRAHGRLEGVSELASTRAGPMEYGDTGTGSPILMIHGSGGGFDQGLQFSSRLIDDGFRVIAPSRFGYLRSPLPDDASPEAQADAFADLLDHLGLDKVAVVGGSAGALSAVQFAIRYPQRCSALVLLVPLGYSPNHVTKPPSDFSNFVIERTLRSDFVFWLAMTAAPETMISTILATNPELLRTAETSERERVERILVSILPVSNRADGLLNDGRLAQSMVPVAIERIQAPVLAISLEDDRYDTLPAAKYMSGQVRDGRLIVYPTGGHVWVGHDAEIFAEIREFIRESTAPR